MAWAAVGAGGCGDADRAPCENGAFDRGTWRAVGSQARGGPTTGPSERQELADRLIACRTLDGRTRSDVRRLLGKPDFPSRARRFYYELGAGRSAGPLDNEFLSVVFDGRARVKAVEIVGF